jgi:hypothetical protein
VRTCSQCGAEDRILNHDPLPGIDRGELDIPHFVREHIEFMKEGQELTPRQIRQGWTAKVIQARRAMYRFLCMDCLNTNYIRRQLNSEQRTKALKLEERETGEENFYFRLCDMDGAY